MALQGFNTFEKVFLGQYLLKEFLEHGLIDFMELPPVFDILTDFNQMGRCIGS